MKTDTSLLILGSALAYFLFTSKKSEASIITTSAPEPKKQEYITNIESSTYSSITDNIASPVITVPINNTVEITASVSTPITVVGTLSNLHINVTTIPTVKTQPVTATIVQPEIKKENIEYITGNTFYADYSIPLFSIINRTVVDKLFTTFTSLGTIGLDAIKNIQNIGKMEWNKLDAGDYTLLALNIITSYITGGYFGLSTQEHAWNYIIDKWLGGPNFEKEYVIKSPEQITLEITNKLEDMYKTYNTSSKNGLLLGFLSKNRVNSSMIPIIKVTHLGVLDDTYITPPLMPIFTSMGYKSDGDIVGYVSETQFNNSCMIKLMYNILLSDFVIVQDKSNYEQILLIYNYIPLAIIGYISTEIQNGQEDTYIPDFEYYEKVKTTIEKGMDSLFNLNSNTALLSKNVSLTPDGNIKFDNGKFPLYKYNPTEQIILPNTKRTFDDNEYYKINNDSYSISSDTITDNKYYATIENRDSTLENVYVLDPDLAVKYMIGENDTYSQYLIYTNYFSVEKDLINLKKYYLYLPNNIHKPTIDDWRSSFPYYIIYNFFSSVMTTLEVIRRSSLDCDITLNNQKYFYTVRRTISSKYWNTLPSLNKQFYVNQNELIKARYKVNDKYADLLIPPRGFYSTPVTEKRDKTVYVRGITSNVMSGSIRMLLRLRDGSLLELFLKKYNVSYGSDYVSLILKKIDSLITSEPKFAKRFVLANCLDVTQGRPAYDMEKIFNSTLV